MIVRKRRGVHAKWDPRCDLLSPKKDRSSGQEDSSRRFIGKHVNAKARDHKQKPGIQPDATIVAMILLRFDGKHSGSMDRRCVSSMDDDDHLESTPQDSEKAQDPR